MTMKIRHGVVIPLLVLLSAPALAADDMAGMDMSGMPGMSMPPARQHSKKARRKSAPAATPSAPDTTMSGMDMPAAAQGEPAAAAASGYMPAMDMGPVPGPGAQAPADGAAQRGGTPPGSGAEPGVAASNKDAMAGMDMTAVPESPASVRSPDYSDGVRYGSMQGMDMDDNARLGKLLVDQLEAFHGRAGDGQRWEAQAWYGNDTGKLWLRSEGERSAGRIGEGDAEALWNRNVSAFWSSQLGLRQDLNDSGPQRRWAAFGVQGISPYWIDVEATAYVGPEGRSALRLRGSHELLLSQRLILQTEAEANAYGRSDPASGLGSGLAAGMLGLRLRYEFRHEFAPYAGIVWERRFAETAGLARDAGQAVSAARWVAGLRFWF